MVFFWWSYWGATPIVAFFYFQGRLMWVVGCNPHLYIYNPPKVWIHTFGGLCVVHTPIHIKLDIKWCASHYITTILVFLLFLIGPIFLDVRCVVFILKDWEIYGWPHIIAIFIWGHPYKWLGSLS